MKYKYIFNVYLLKQINDALLYYYPKIFQIKFAKLLSQTSNKSLRNIRAFFLFFKIRKLTNTVNQISRWFHSGSSKF